MKAESKQNQNRIKNGIKCDLNLRSEIWHGGKPKARASKEPAEIQLPFNTEDAKGTENRSRNLRSLEKQSDDASGNYGLEGVRGCRDSAGELGREASSGGADSENTATGLV